MDASTRHPHPLEVAGSAAAGPGASLSTILGPEVGRYFGEGYRRVAYTIRWAPEPGSSGGHCTWIGSVHYPAGWSVDSQGRDRPQHLATVDALVLAVAAWERDAVARGHKVVPGSSRLDSVRVVAGARPWLDLSEVPISLVEAPAGGSGAMRRVTGSVGGLDIELGITSAEALRSSAVTPPIADAVAGTVYGAGFRGTRVSTWVEKVDVAIGLMDTRHHAFSDLEPGTMTGLDAAVFPAMCAVDHLITMGQVAQALALAMMRQERVGMGNMWMRSVELHMEPVGCCLPVMYEATCRIERSGPRRRRSGTYLYDLTARSETSLGAVGVASLAYETKAEK